MLLCTMLCYPTLAQHRHTILFYNVENLFDTINSPTTADEDMLPLADKEWNSEKYHKKLSQLAKVFSTVATPSASEPHAQSTIGAYFPTLIGLAEVENRTVLEDLVREPTLTAANYGICHYDSPDERGIDVALLYRKDYFQIEGSRAIRSAAEGRTRDHLTVWGRIDEEPFFIIVSHLPSRIGGVRFTEPQRITSARQIKAIADSVMRASPTTKIIIMGDMNDNPTNRSLRQELRAEGNLRKLQHNSLYNPFRTLRGAHRGSSVYDGRWNMYDNIILSANAVGGSGLILQNTSNRRQAAVYRSTNLLDHRGHPKPTYKGTEYEGGVSDHLPIYITIGR